MMTTEDMVLKKQQGRDAIKNTGQNKTHEAG